MTNTELFELISCFDRSTAQSLKLSTQEFTIELARGQACAPAESAATSVQPISSSTSQPQHPTITAPMVGTFYAAPAPDQPPFVSAGDRVKKGQTLCLLEAMKMMSEVPAPCDCVILEVLQENGALAQFGQDLFRYQPC